MSPELTKVVQLEQRGVGARAESLGEGARGEEDGLLDEGKQPLIAAEDAGHGRQCQRHAAQYYAVLQRSAERKRFECANEYGPLRGGGPEMLEHSELSRTRADREDGQQRDGTERQCCRTLDSVPARSA